MVVRSLSRKRRSWLIYASASLRLFYHRFPRLWESRLIKSAEAR